MLNKKILIPAIVVCGLLLAATALVSLQSDAKSKVTTNDLSLSQTQMLADFDQLVQFISDFGVHKDINRNRLGIDYASEYAALRSRITSGMSPCEFNDVLESAINLVQDGHASSIGFEYLSQYGQYQSKYNFESSSYAKVKQYEELCGREEKALTLPIHYVRGRYQFFLNFDYAGESIGVGDEVVAINGNDIDAYLRENLHGISPVRWDAKRKKLYHPQFYKTEAREFTLSVRSGDTTRDVKFRKSVPVPVSDWSSVYGYNTGSVKPIVTTLFNDGYLYISIPTMSVDNAKTILELIASQSLDTQRYEKILVDIRGNPGGNDQAWHAVMGKLINKPIGLHLDLKFKHTEAAIQKYAVTNDPNNQWNRENHDTTPEKIDILGEDYWTVDQTYLELPPSSDAMRHAGKIYVLQDRFIYSSASNLARVSLFNDQLVSVGESTDLIGGLQTEPLFIELNHSELVFRIEPLLDYSGVKTIADLEHNSVEHPFAYSSEMLHEMVTADNVRGKRFLETKDALIQFVRTLR